MKEFKIEVPKGHEIDTENSSLESGVIKFKKVRNKKSIVTALGFGDCEINNEWAFNVFETGLWRINQEEVNSPASLYLAHCNGTWRDEKGNKIQGYLFYEPDNE